MAKDLMAKYHQKQKDKQKAGKNFLLSLCPALKAAKIRFLTAHYDGCGDEGFIESDGIHAYTDAKRTEKAENPPFTARQVADAAYDVLEGAYPGWEINEGSFGDVVLDVKNATVKIEHNFRVESSEYYETEV
jgi:hypothetical protein